MATTFSFVCEFSERIADRESDGTTTVDAKMMKPVRAVMMKNMTNRLLQTQLGKTTMIETPVMMSGHRRNLGQSVLLCM
ncbi:hypothetical protein GBA52_019122 [Prunus armeniaca]|nr:hypothetical protein GBA52_019122 [Prunus armeniaca]